METKLVPGEKKFIVVSTNTNRMTTIFAQEWTIFEEEEKAHEFCDSLNRIRKTGLVAGAPTGTQEGIFFPAEAIYIGKSKQRENTFKFKITNDLRIS